MARGKLWSDAEVAALIALWGRGNSVSVGWNTQKLKGTLKMAAKLQENDGFKQTFVECREKVKKLKMGTQAHKGSKHQVGQGENYLYIFRTFGCNP